MRTTVTGLRFIKGGNYSILVFHETCDTLGAIQDAILRALSKGAREIIVKVERPIEKEVKT